MGEKFYIDQDRSGDERSLYSDMIRSRDYSDPRANYTMTQLCGLEHYWKGQLESPERSPRARSDISKLIARTAFEIDMRQIEHVELSRRQAEEDLAWQQYSQEMSE